jgi:cell division cycle 20-like protein 1 (cofactor of APC complex)
VCVLDCVARVCRCRGGHVAIGTKSGEVQLWDVARGKLVRAMGGHQGRAGALAWSSTVLASGSRDRSVLLRDPRAQQPFFSTLAGHKQEVCGLKWSFDETQLAVRCLALARARVPAA